MSGFASASRKGAAVDVIWILREPAWTEIDVTGYKVEALDGDIGTVDEATYDVRASRIVVDTGPWIFGKKVILPAGTIEEIDSEEKVVRVDRTKDEIKNAPAYDYGNLDAEERHRKALGDYYGAPQPGTPGRTR
jgi:hypothetical protein